MNTWVVGNMPIGHKVYNYSNSVVNKEQGTEIRGEKTFFMKARMMAGQANLKDNVFGLQDFQWLDREETRKAVNPRDWAAVKNILSER
jgi:large subunit ribosomal protein L46